MKKLMSVIGLLFVLNSGAQSFVNGQIDVNAGIGLGNSFARGYTSMFPPLSLSVDVGVADYISVGGYFAYASAKWDYEWVDYSWDGNSYMTHVYTDTYKWSYYILGARGAYHFAKFIDNDKFDLYGGAMLGYNIATSKYTTTGRGTRDFTGTDYGGFAWSVFGGGRYRFTEHFGVFSELGYGITYLSLGVNYRI